MNNLNNIHSFLSNFSIKQLQDVIDDIKLDQEGYEIYYIVDTYDIMNYALPFSQGDFNGDKSKATSHRTIAYDTIFDKKAKSNLILLDEYKLELLSLKNQIHDKLKGFPRIKQKLIQLIQSKGIESEENLREAANIVKRNFDIIIALQIFVEYGDNIYQRFTNLLNNNLTIFEFNTGNREFDVIADNIFDNTRTTNLTSIIYDKYVDKVKYKLISMDTDYERFNYLENAYRDIAVIDRIIGITKKFNEKYREKKIVFQYLSSAPYKTSSLFGILKDLDIGINHNFNRNIFQCFLYKSFKKLNRERDSTTEIIELLYNTMLEKSFIEKSINIIDEINPRKENDFIKNMNILLLDSENDIKNTLIYNSYEEHSKTLKNALKQIQSTSQRKILSNFFNRTDSFLQNDSSLFLNKFECATLSIQKYRQTYLLSNRVFDNDELYEIRIPFGKDIIRNTFQHLPVLPFIGDENDYSESMNEICKLITQSPNTKHNKVDFNTAIKTIIQQLSKNPTINIKEITIEFIILSYLNLITKTSKTFELSVRENYNNSENELVDALKAQRSIIAKTMISGFHNKLNNKLDITERKGQFLKEIDYLLLWLLRRNHNCSMNETNLVCSSCKYDEVITFGEECISKYTNDGRFYHGLALAFHSKGYAKLLHCKNEKDNSSIVIELLSNSNQLLLKSLDYYNKSVENTKNETTFLLLVRNIIAIYNTIIDCKLRNYQLSINKNENLLKEAEEYIQLIKVNFQRINEDISDYPTINHTIAELCYCESKLHFDREEYSKSFEKVSSATFVIYNFENKKENIPENFYSIVHDINKLRYQLFEKMNML